MVMPLADASVGKCSVKAGISAAALIYVISIMKGSKRSSLQSPNPVKYSAADDDTEQPAPSHRIGTSAMPDTDADHVEVPVSGANGVSESSSSPPSCISPKHPSTPDINSRVTVAPKSPVSNRDRFLAGFTPLRTCCNLDLCRAPAGNKFNLSAICIAVYPASRNPDRRYVQLADNTGVVGVTVWNENVNKFNEKSVGSLVVLTKAVISSHNGKKQLTLARDSIVKVGEDVDHEVCSWWSMLLRQTPQSCGSVHDMPDNTIICLTGIVGRVSCEMKMVNSSEKALTVLHLCDASGKLDVRTWNHTPDTFARFVDRPILIQRVKVSSFAGTKLCELFDAEGSVFVSDFPGKTDLELFWKE